MDKILELETIHDYHSFIGYETLHPLISVIDFSKVKPLRHARKRYGFYAVVLKHVKCGDVRYGKNWGISEATENVIRRAHSVCPLTAVENRYSMMARHYEALFPVLEELGIGFVPFSPLANGLLSDRYNQDSRFEPGTDYRSSMPQFRPESFAANRQLLDMIRNLAETKSATPAQISLAWMLCKKPWIAPIPGTRKLSRLQENAGASDIILTAEEVKQIDDTLGRINMSEVFGETKIKANENL